jgi:putative nucleotidyltransferase with HDIG domain
MAFIPAPIAENLVMSADVFVISLSFIFVNLYAGICCKIASWDKIYYASIYLSFFLLQMVFNYTYVTAAGSVVCNILVPLIVIWYYIRKLMPLYISIKKKPEVKVSRSLFLLPAMAELFFVYRSFVIIAISAKYPEVALNDMYANAILTGFSYILTGFVFVCMTTLLKNILDEQDIKCETKKNKELTTDMIKALVKTIDAKDPYTNGHSIRVAEYTRMLAEQAYTDSDELHNIYNIALLHDIGKIGIPDNIINKPGKLTDEEYNIIKGHTLTGAKILSEIKSAPELIYGGKI